jgi:hypothetical protein
MRIVLLHLSDIHFRSPNDPVAERVLKIKEAVLGKFLRADACFIAVSGDVANSGDPAEYSVAVTFFIALRSALLLSGFTRVEFVVSQETTTVTFEKRTRPAYSCSMNWKTT